MPARSAGAARRDDRLARRRLGRDPHPGPGVGLVQQHADHRVHGLAGRDQLLGRDPHLVARDGEPDADAARLRPGVPPPGSCAIAELTPITSPVGVDQRAAGVARVDRRVGLDRVDERRLGRPRHRP